MSVEALFMSDQHYLRDEMYDLIKKDDAIFEFLQSASLDGIWYWDLENPEHEWMNAKFWITLGYDPADMPHRADTWQDIIFPEDRDEALKRVQAHFANPDVPYSQVVRYRHQNGSTVWIRCRGIAIRDENGTPVRLLGAHNDITKLKEAERQATRDAQRYKRLVESQSAYLITLNLEGNYTYVNDYYCDDFGWPRETLLGHASSIGVVEEDQSVCKQVGQACFANPGKRVKARLRKIDANGVLKTGDWEFTAQVAEGDLPPELVCVGVDVTEQVKAEAALKASEAQFRFIAENTSDGILMFNYDKIVYASPAYTCILGYSVVEEKARTEEDIYALLHPEDRERIRTLVDNAISRQQHYFSYEYRALHKDGHYVWREDRATLFYGDNGLPVSSILVARDITERKQAEADLLRTTTLLKDAQRIANMGAWELDVATNQAMLSEQLYAIFELPVGTPVTGAEVIAYHHPDDQHTLTQAINQTIELHVPFDVQCRLISAKGKHLWVWASGYPVLENDRVIRLIGSFQDITGQKQLEKYIRESEQQLFSTLASMDDEVFVIDSEGVFREIYNSVQNDSYLPPEVLLDQAYDAVLPPAFVDTTRDVFAKAEHSLDTKTFAFDYSLEHNGCTRWFSAKATTRFGLGGAFDGVTVVARDITDYKQAQDALRESESRYRLLTANISDLISLTDVDGHYVYLSPSHERVLGYSLEERRAMVHFTLIHPDDVERAAAALRQAETESVQNVQYRVRRKDGVYIWLEANINIVHDETADEPRLLRASISRDITDRKQAEHALAESEAKFRSFVENANDVIITLSPQGELLYISPMWETVKGFSADGLVGTSFVSLVHPDDMPSALEALQTIVISKETHSGLVYRSTYGDGSWHWFAANGAPIIDGAGNVTAILVTVRDITRDKTAEHAMQATLRRLEQALANNDLLMKELHHRVKNNLAIIASLLVLQARGLKDDTAKHALRESRTRIVAMSEIHALMYRQDSSKNIAFHDYLASLVERMERSFGRLNGIGFSFASPEVDVTFDQAIPLGLIINELLTNATKYAFDENHANPHVDITVALDDGLTLTVTDNGVGLADDKALETSDSLGMTVIHALTDQLGGQVSFQNRPTSDVGLQVTLHMPLVEVSAQDKRVAAN